MPSFDIVSEVDKQEVRNAVDQVNKEVSTRFDFKGSDARVEQADYVLTVHADTEFQLDQVQEILAQKLAKRSVDVKCLDIGSVEKVSGNKVKRSVTVKTGVETELAKKIVKCIKDSKLKVQASIQGDTVRVSGAKRDLLQDTIALVQQEHHRFSAAVSEFPRLKFGRAFSVQDTRRRAWPRFWFPWRTAAKNSKPSPSSICCAAPASRW